MKNLVENHRYGKMRKLEAKREDTQKNLDFALQELKRGDQSQSPVVADLSQLILNYSRQITSLRDKLGIYEIGRVNQQDPNL